MPPELDHEEDYVSEEDSDFAPEDGVEQDLSASEDDVPDAAKPKPKRQAGDRAAEDAGFDNSGDEGIIEKGKKRQKKAKAKDRTAGEDEGGEGGLVKTRSMRAAEKEERRTTVARGPVTIDVDALWAQMANGPAPPTGSQDENQEESAEIDHDESDERTQQSQQQTTEPSEMIRIERTYNFAGKVHTEEKLVSRDSAEAKLYLASLAEDAGIGTEADLPPKRMPRKAFRSVFEPIIDQGLQRADLHLGMAARLQLREQADKKNAQKLNTVEKSRMDWAGYVDKEGIKDELELASKSKANFTARQAFLARSEAIRDDDARRARQATRV